MTDAKLKLDDSEQSKPFIDMAHEIQAEQDGAGFGNCLMS